MEQLLFINAAAHSTLVVRRRCTPRALTLTRTAAAAPPLPSTIRPTNQPPPPHYCGGAAAAGCVFWSLSDQC